LVINGFGQHGISIETNGNNVVTCNFIGTDITGTVDRGNGNNGIQITTGASNNIIGGTTAGARNLISGNEGRGVNSEDSGTNSNTIAGNYIGTNVTGTAALSNSSGGIKIDTGSSNNTIGGTAAEAGNLIAYNGGDGVSIVAGTNNAILSNRIFASTRLGIDLNPDEVTDNDSGDTDTGPNNLQNFPVLTSVISSSGNITISGVLSSTAGTTFSLQFFDNAECDPSGYGEGENLLSTNTVTTTGTGIAPFNISVPSLEGQFVTATATDPDGNTSEFSQCASPRADLVISKSASSAAAIAGTTLTYTLAITNDGPSAAHNVVVTDTLPASVTVAKTNPSTRTQSGRDLVWTLGTLANGGMGTITLAVTVDAAFSGTLVNTATVTSITADQAPDNNTNTETTLVNGVADLSVSKTANITTPVVGQPITFTVAISNTGPGQATNVQLSDPLPTQLGFVSASPDQSDYDSSTGLWTVGTITNGTTITLTLVVTPNTAGAITNTAQITTSDQIDRDSTPGNNLEAEDDQDSAVITATTPVSSPVNATTTDSEGISPNLNDEVESGLSTTGKNQIFMPIIIKAARAGAD
jgi:uncharacterized repeat protein (TIGR01451 family)